MQGARYGKQIAEIERRVATCKGARDLECKERIATRSLRDADEHRP